MVQEMTWRPTRPLPGPIMTQLDHHDHNKKDILCYFIYIYRLYINLLYRVYRFVVSGSNMRKYLVVSDRYKVYQNSTYLRSTSRIVSVLWSILNHREIINSSTHRCRELHICVSKLDHRLTSIMDCRLIGAKPLSEPMRTACKFGPWEIPGQL